MTSKALIDYDRLLDTLITQGHLLIASSRTARPEAPVPLCPGLTIGETVRHVGSVYRMVHQWIRTGDRPQDWQRSPSGWQSAADYMREALADLVEELRAHDPDAACATWWEGHKTYGFWRRRMAHETTVHRIDVQTAALLEVDGVDDEIAVDGIDEVLHLWFMHRLQVLGVNGTSDRKVAVQAGGRTWLTHASRTGTSTTRVTEAEASTADAVVSGSPMDVYLWLWGRRHISSVITEERHDHDAVAQLWALLRLATR